MMEKYQATQGRSEAVLSKPGPIGKDPIRQPAGRRVPRNSRRNPLPNQGSQESLGATRTGQDPRKARAPQARDQIKQPPPESRIMKGADGSGCRLQCASGGGATLLIVGQAVTEAANKKATEAHGELINNSQDSVRSDSATTDIVRGEPEHLNRPGTSANQGFIRQASKSRRHPYREARSFQGATRVERMKRKLRPRGQSRLRAQVRSGAGVRQIKQARGSSILPKRESKGEGRLPPNNPTAIIIKQE